MWRYLAKRLGQALLTLVVLTSIVFIGQHLSGDPALQYLSAEHSTQADYERLRAQLGLDKPLPVQYATFLARAAQGDFGTSIFYRRPVSELVFERLPATIQLATTAMLLALLIGIPMGVVAAIKRGSWIDKATTTISIAFMSAPQFWVGIVLLTVFAAELHWLPSYGGGGPDHLVLPAVTLALYLIAGFVRLTRSGMLEVLDSDYIRFARMKGLNEPVVVWKHGLRNGLIPVVTFAGIMLGAMLNGTIVVEQLFAWPGIGRLAVDAVFQRDFPVLQGTVLVGGFFFVLSAYVVDILYFVIDPRVRSGGS
jgi:ABC-type dipeptide/oligopeptide/nickel transport system permease component